MTEKQLRHEVSRLIKENTKAWGRNCESIAYLADNAGIGIRTCYNIVEQHSGGLKPIIKVLHALGYELEIRRKDEI